MQTELDRRREEERWNNEEWSKKAMATENGKETEQAEGRGRQGKKDRKL